jgi:hypothetical protein
MIKTNDGQMDTETKKDRPREKGRKVGGDTKSVMKRGFKLPGNLKTRNRRKQGKEEGWIGNERQNQPD